MNFQKKALIFLAVSVFVAVSVSYLVWTNRRDSDGLARLNAPTVQTSSTVISRADSEVCEIIDYLDRLDVTSEYAVTHAIIDAGGPEDTLNTALEACGLEVPR